VAKKYVKIAKWENRSARKKAHIAANIGE